MFGQQKQPVDLSTITTPELLEELLIRGLIIAPENSEDGEDLRARLQSTLNAVSEYRFAKRDPFEMQELFSKTVEIAVSNMPDPDLKLTLDKIGGSLVKYLNISKNANGIYSRNIYASDLMEMIRKFLEFVTQNNIPSVNTYDRFKPIYEKFIAITPNADNIIGEDTMGFFNKLKQAGLK